MAGAGEDAMDVDEKKPDSSETFLASDTPNYTEKYKKYEADYVRWLKAKYFSRKNLYGGIIFDNEVAIENETIKSSRWPCTRSFTDPVQSFEDQNRFLVSAAENSTYHPNNKYKSSFDMDKVDKLQGSPGVPCVTADPSVNSEVEALSGPKAETMVQRSSMEGFAEQTMRSEGPPVDALSAEHADANQVRPADVPSTNTSPPSSVEAAKSSNLTPRGI